MSSFSSVSSVSSSPTSEGIVSARSDWKVWSSFSLVPIYVRTDRGHFSKTTLKFSGRLDPSLAEGKWVKVWGTYVAKFGGQVEVRRIRCDDCPSISLEDRVAAVLRACKWRSRDEPSSKRVRLSGVETDDEAVLRAVRAQRPSHPQWSRVWLSAKNDEPDDDEMDGADKSKPASSKFADITYAELRDALALVAEDVYWNAKAVTKLSKDAILQGRATAKTLGEFLVETLRRHPYASWFYGAQLDVMRMLRPVYDARVAKAHQTMRAAATYLLQIRSAEDDGNTHLRLERAVADEVLAETREWPWDELRTDDGFLYRARALEAERAVAECVRSCVVPDDTGGLCFVAPTGRAARRAREAVIEYGSRRPELDATQSAALEKLCSTPCTVLTGAAGSGKTTLLAAMVTRLLRGADLETHTMHKIICMQSDNVREKFGSTTTLIIDEASMVDLMTMARLVWAFSSAKVAVRSIVFVGDLNQLPPIRMGGVLSSLVRSKAVPTCVLSSDHRQSGDGGAGILRNMSRVLGYEGLFAAPFAAEMQSDGGFRTKIVEDCKDTKDELLSVTEATYRSVLEIERESGERPQVLCQLNRVCDALNPRLRERYNPRRGRAVTDPMRTTTGAEWVYCEDDVVISNKNLYLRDPDPETGKMGRWFLGVSNGEMGTVVRVEGPREVVVQFENASITYVKQLDEDGGGDGRTREFDRVQPAYAISIHKFQGSEARNVVVAIFQWKDDRHSRQWLYTGCTRGKDRCTLVGSAGQLGACYRVAETGACRVGELVLKARSKIEQEKIS